MMDALLHAGQRLAEALDAENQALLLLDLPGAILLADAKRQATDAFAAACAAAARTGTRAEGPLRASTTELTQRLQSLGEENRRLLQRAISIQAQVIETIAGAALPRAGSGAYGAGGRPAAPRRAPALAVATRA
jgi:flagellar biosynthesis/type III secretory pathway chaperone